MKVVLEPLGIEVRGEVVGMRFRIAEQHSRDINFRASSGFTLTTAGHPEVGRNNLYLKGSDKGLDTQVLYTPVANYLAACDAVDEYNATEPGSVS